MDVLTTERGGGVSPAAAARPAVFGSSTGGMEEEGALSLDTVLGTLRRYWWLVLLAAGLGGAGAWYAAECLPFTYEKTASVMMRDPRQQPGSPSALILSELGVDEGAANIANESFILKSTALMQRVAEELGAATTYWTRKGLRDVELYDESPLSVTFSELPEQRGCAVSVTPRDEKSFVLSYANAAGERVELEGGYGQAVQLPFAAVTVQPTARMDGSWEGRSVEVRRAGELECVRGLLAALKVTRPDEKDASLLEMTLTAHNAKKAEDVLNHLIGAYNRQSLDERRESARKTQEFIVRRLEELGRTLGEVDSRIADSQAKGEIAIDAATTLTADFAASQELAREIFDLETQMKLADELSQRLDATARGGGLISVDTGLADGSLSSKIETYNEAWLEYARISGSAGAKNPVAVSLKDRMATTLEAARRALANYRSNQRLRLGELRAKEETLSRRLAETADRSRDLSPLMLERKVREELYMLLLTKEQENALALYIAEPGARALETAYGPDAPISPRTALITAAGAGGGGVLCLLAILGLSMLDRKVHDKHDLEGHTTLPAAAELPSLTRRERRAGVFGQGSHSAMAEHLHILRNNVDNLLPRPETGGPLLLITSTMAGEGKTFVASHLAAAYAQAGRRVLLVDGDLRKGSLTHALGAKGRRGFSTLLLRHAEDPAELIRTLPGDAAGRIDLLASGPLPPNPVTLLSQPLLGRLLLHLRRRYDAVILDAPPLGILADTDILAAQADLTLYIVRSGMVDKRFLSQIQKLADAGRLPNPAFVVNDVNFRASSHYRYGYGYGYYRYGYGDEKRSRRAANFSTPLQPPPPGSESDSKS